MLPSNSILDCKYFFCLLIFLSCEDLTESGVLDNNGFQQNEEVIEYSKTKSRVSPKKNRNEFSIEVINNHSPNSNHISALSNMGFKGSYGLFAKINSPIRGLNFKGYIIDKDIFIPLNSIERFLTSSDSIYNYQYRTRTIVDASKYNKLRVAITGFGDEKDRFITATENAIENYNELNLDIEFEYVGYLENWISAFNHLKPNILISSRTQNGGFSWTPLPSGRPGPFIIIGKNSFSDRNIDLGIHLITHEIGHAIGLRHTDFFDRSLSCGPCENFGDSNCSDNEEDFEEHHQVGAIHIPGTPARVNIDLNSVMKACYNGRENGEFTNYDRDALIYIY